MYSLNSLESVVNRYGKPLDLTDFAAYIVQNIKQLENIFGKDYSKDRNVDKHFGSMDIALKRVKYKKIPPAVQNRRGIF